MPNRRERLAAALLVAPLLLFLLGVFLLPIGAFLWRAVAETDVAPALPRTLAALRDWSGRDLPGEAAFEALAADLRAARAADQAAGGGLIPRAAARLNAEIPGFRSTLPATARRLSSPEAPARETILAASPDWSKPESWAAIRRTGGPVSDLNLLAALDLRRDAAGGIAAPDSLARAREAGLDPRALLAGHDSYAVFAALGDLVMTGPTLTNVNDVRAVLVT